MESFGINGVDWGRSRHWGHVRNGAYPGRCIENCNNVMADLSNSEYPDCNGTFMTLGWLVASPQQRSPAFHYWITWLDQESGELFCRIDPTLQVYRGVRWPFRWYPVAHLTLKRVRRTANLGDRFPCRPEEFPGGIERLAEASEYLEQMRGMQPGWWEIGGRLDYCEEGDRLTQEEVDRIPELLRAGKTREEINREYGFEVVRDLPVW